MSSPSALVHSLTLEQLKALCEEMGLPKFRANQIWHWLYVQKADDWSAMLNLPKALRADFASRLHILPVVAAETQGDPADTRKILGLLQDGERLETVLIPAPSRRTVCVSTQVGCAFHCAFCASGQAGFRRNLEAGEIVGQILLAQRAFAEPLTNIVYMGMGEPFDNYDAVLTSVRILNDKDGLNIGARRITLSTCGVIPGIQRLAGEGVQVELSVSLHAPDDALRSELMPVNRKYPLAELIAACRDYFAKTNRLVTFEYTLVQGLNDQPSHAKELIALLSGFPCRVNLIPLSPVSEFKGQASTPPVAEQFMVGLEKAGINTTLRQSKGASLQAACGQLRFAR